MARADDLIAEINRQATETVRKAVADALAPYGGLREEWGYRYGDMIEEGFNTETGARATAHPGDTIVRRIVGDWIAVGGRLADEATAGALSDTETDARGSEAPEDANPSSIYAQDLSGPDDCSCGGKRPHDCRTSHCNAGQDAAKGAGRCDGNITVIKQHPMIGDYWAALCSCGGGVTMLYKTHDAALQAARDHEPGKRASDWDAAKGVDQ